MVNDSIGVDSNTSCSAGLDHISELISCSHSAVKLVGSWLINEPPWVELTLLWPNVSCDRFLWWENFDSHVSGLTKELALFLDISVWPSKELDNSSLLTTFIVLWLLDLSTLPDEVVWLQSDLPIFSISVGSFDN